MAGSLRNKTVRTLRLMSPRVTRNKCSSHSQSLCSATDLDYDTYTGFSLNATEDIADPRKQKMHKSKSQRDMESANVSISQKPKNRESQKRRITDNKIQDSTNIGEVEKSRNLMEGQAKSCKKARTGYCENSVEALSLNDCTGESQTGITEGQKEKKTNDQTNECMTQSAFKTKTSHDNVSKQPSVQSTSRVKEESERPKKHNLCFQSQGKQKEEKEVEYFAIASDNEDNINPGQDYTGCLSCYLCSEEQADGARYIHHLAMQHNIKAYLCPYCTASMSSFEQLKRHLKFSCRYNSVLIRPHRCEVCPAKFAHIYVLIRHVKALHENNPDLYPCSHCRRTFTDPKNAKVHSAKCKEGLASTEEKIKTVKCSQCGKMFSSRRSLYSHTKTIHGKAVFKCLCGLSFLGSRYFYAHSKVCGLKDFVVMDS